MDSGLNPNGVIKVTCAQCGHKFGVTLREFELHSDDGFPCPERGTRYLLDVSELDQKVNENLRRFRRHFRMR